MAFITANLGDRSVQIISMDRVGSAVYISYIDEGNLISTQLLPDDGSNPQITISTSAENLGILPESIHVDVLTQENGYIMAIVDGIGQWVSPDAVGSPANSIEPSTFEGDVMATLGDETVWSNLKDLPYFSELSTSAKSITFSVSGTKFNSINFNLGAQKQILISTGNSASFADLSATYTTSNLPEGSNLYYTDVRVGSLFKN